MDGINMTIDLATIHDVARASMVPDFFAVRIDEEGLFDGLKQLIARIELKAPHLQFDRIKQIGATASDATAFIEAIKREGLFVTLRDILTKIPVT
jgi:hypothetical protein